MTRLPFDRGQIENDLQTIWAWSAHRFPQELPFEASGIAFHRSDGKIVLDPLFRGPRHGPDRTAMIDEAERLARALGYHPLDDIHFHRRDWLLLCPRRPTAHERLNAISRVRNLGPW